MKKIIIAILAVVASLCCFTACNGSQPEKGEQAGKKVLQFASESVSVEMFKELQLDYDMENIAEQVKFSSSNTSIVTVDNIGKIVAVKEGSAVVTMSAGKLSDTIKVKVTACDLTKLELFYEFDSLNIYETYSKEIKPIVLYDGVKIDGGEFTYAISNENVSLTANTVTGQSKGDATLTISGSIRGIALNPLTVQLKVYEKLEILMDEEESEYQIFVFEGSQGQNAITEIAFNPIIKLNDNVLTDAIVEVSIDDNTIVKYNDGKIIAEGVGETQVTFSYLSQKQTKIEKSISVVVDKPLVQLSKGEGVYAKNRNEALTYTASDLIANLVSVSSVRFGGSNLSAESYSIKNGCVIINNDALVNKLDSDGNFVKNELIIIAESAVEKVELTQSLTVYDFAIGNVEEFVQWASTYMLDRCGKGAPLYSVLTANVDLSKIAFADAPTNYTNNSYIETKDRTVYSKSNIGNGNSNGFGYGYGVLQGELDGQGFTVNGLLHTQSGLFNNVGIANGAGFTLRNIAFTNIELMRNDTTTARYIFGNAKSKIVLENVYLQISKTSGGASCITNITNDSTQLSLKNCVIDYAFTYAEGAPAYTKAGVFNNAGPQKGAQSVFAISKTTWTSANDTLPPKTGYVYENNVRRDSYSALKTAISEAEVDISVFTNSCWTLDYGMPLFETAKDYFEIAPEITCSSIASGLADPGTHELKVTYGATVELLRAIDGVSVEDNVLTIAKTAKNGAEIELEASYVNVYGVTCTNTVTYKVSNITEVKLFDSVQVYGKNRGDLVLDLTSYSLSEIIVVQVGETAIETATLSANKLTIPATTFEANKEKGIIAIIDNYKFIATFKVVDFAIGDADEFLQWSEAMKTGTASSSAKYAVLTANVDISKIGFAYQTTNYTKDKREIEKYGYGNGYIHGELDGQGYTVDGLLHVAGALFYNVANCGFTFKNIAFTNIQLMHEDTAKVRYVFTSKMAKQVTFDNVYLQITKTTALASTELSITNDCGEIIPKNCVFDFAFTYAEGAITYSKAPIFRNRTPVHGAENVFAISKTTFLASSDTLVAKDGYTYANNGRFESATALASAISAGTLDMSMFTASPYWDTTAGYPVWKNLPKSN